jgi:hypothetical protein
MIEEAQKKARKEPNKLMHGEEAVTTRSLRARAAGWWVMARRAGDLRSRLEERRDRRDRDAGAQPTATGRQVGRQNGWWWKRARERRRDD